MSTKNDVIRLSNKKDTNGSNTVSSSINNETRMLLEQFKNGDDAAFEVIYTQWFTPIFNLLKRLTGSAHDAEDITQDVFCTLWNKRNAIDTSKDIKGFIFSLARNNAADHRRKSNSADNYLADGGHTSESDVTPHDIAVTHEIKLLTDYAIRTMPEERRKVFVLNYEQGLKPAEIAEKLDISPKSVYDHIYKAREDIAKLIPTLVLLAIFSLKI